MNLDAIATAPALAGLRARPQWVLWRLVPDPDRPDKPKKLPFNARTWLAASSTDPTTWAPFDVALASARTGPGWGLGYVFAADHAFVDLDGALRPDGTWSPLAVRVCEALRGAAVEVSQSGTGLHLICRGTLPPHSNKNIAQRAELYTMGRFVALTGAGLSGDCEADCSAGLASLAGELFPPRSDAGAAPPHDGPRPDWRGPPDTPEGNAELLRRMLRSRSAASVFGGNRASFADLWHADAAVLARAYPPDASSSDPFDHSSADAALFQHLAWGTGCDRGRMLRIAQGSALKREKWERADYLERTITNACRMQRDVLQDKPQATPPPRLTFADAERQIAALSEDERRAGAWAPIVAQASHADAELLLHRLEYQVGLGRQALKATLREHRQAEADLAHTARLAASAAGRVQIEWQPGSSADCAAEVEGHILRACAPGEWLQFGGLLARVAITALPHAHHVAAADEPPPAVPQLEPMTTAAIVAQVERAVQLIDSTGRRPKAIDTPDRLVDMLRNRPDRAAPACSGLLVHPVVLPSGEILADDGLHRATGLFLHGASLPGVRPFAQHEAGQALAWLRAELFAEFEFADALDADAAVAGLLTGLQRRILDMAPGLAVLASTQSSGKTTLARVLHLVLTGRDVPATTWADDEQERQKQLLALLLRSPAAVLFDNLADGATLRSPSLAGAMTAPMIDQRVLGASKNAQAPTNTLMIATGNNLSFGTDEASRWLVCRLAPKTARPEERRFRHADVQARALAIRADALRCAVGIVAGYLSSGASLGAGTRFVQWDRVVRQPLLWSGGRDMAEVFRKNAGDNPHGRAHVAILYALSRAFGGAEFTSAKVLDAAACHTDQTVRETLAEALETLAAGRRPDTARSVGTLLAAIEGRIGEVDGLPRRLRSRVDGHRGSKVFTVV